MDDLGFVPQESPPAASQAPTPTNDGLGFEPSSSTPDEGLGFVPSEEPSKYGTPGQQLLTGVEGAAQGVLGPVATIAEQGLSSLGVPGLKDEDIKGRVNENPNVHALSEYGAMGASMLAGTGEAALIGRGLRAVLPEATTVMGKIGMGALKGAIENGALQGGDEISKALLNDTDPQAPVATALAHVGAASLLGGGLGGITSSVGQAGVKGLQALENNKVGTRAKNVLAGIGVAAKMKELGIPMEDAEKFIGSRMNMITHGMQDDLKYKDIKPGLMAFEKMHDLGTKAVGGVPGNIVGGILGGGLTGELAGGYISDKIFHPMAEKILNKAITKSNKYTLPLLMRTLANGHVDKLAEVLDYATKINKGSRDITNAVDGLFKSGGQQLYNYDTNDKQREKLRQLIEGQQPETTQYAEGGQVPRDAFTEAMPIQSGVIAAAKTRVNDYLKNKQPKKQSELSLLPYDQDHANPLEEKAYNKALDVANAPLSVLNEIKKGTIDIEHMQHLTQMYPDLYETLKKKLVDKAAEYKTTGEKPNYKVRQGLSIFLGQPMDSTFTPFGLQQAQSVFAPKAPAQQPGKPKGSPAKLKDKSTNIYKTPEQAGEEDQSKRG